MATRNRPRRGSPSRGNVLVRGDTGPRQPQHGAEPGATESGDLQAREFGVPQADLPGGVRHLVNTETVPAETVDKPRRPADYHKYHGVPSDDGQYYVTPDETTLKTLKATPEPKFDDAVPVRIVEGTKVRSIRKLVTSGPLLIPAAATVDPIHIAVRDPNRVDFWICNETAAGGAGQATPGIRIGDYETCADLRGMLIPAATLQRFAGAQDEVYVTNQSGTAITISWGYLTEVEEAGV